MNKKPSKNFMGRPNERQNEMQKLYMIALTKKMPVLNSQSQLQILFYQFIEKNTNKKDKVQDEKTVIKQKIQYIIRCLQQNLNFKLAKEMIISVYKMFVDNVNQWRFIEVQTQKQFPKYLFDDQLDLTYHISKYFQKRNQDISTLELLCFQLLCLAGRNFLSNQIIKQMIIINFEDKLFKIQDQLRKKRINLRKLEEYMFDEEESQLFIYQENKIKNSKQQTQKKQIKNNQQFQRLRQGYLNGILNKQLSFTKPPQPIQKHKLIKKQKSRGRPLKQNKTQKHLIQIKPENMENIINIIIYHIQNAYKYVKSE